MVIKNISEAIGIGGLNSVWSSSRDKEKGKLWLGHYQIAQSLKNIKKAMFSIALIHHPTNWFNDYDDPKLGRDIEQSFRFCLHGHEHQGWVTKTDDHVRVSASACLNLTPVGLQSLSNLHVRSLFLL